jgi:hypothetical protein
VCSGAQPTAVAETRVAPPTIGSATASVSNPRTEIEVSATATSQGDARTITYKVQCLEDAQPTPTDCDESGRWVDAASLANGQAFGLLSPDTGYVCFAAATYDDNGTQYACSGPSQVVSTDPLLFYLVGSLVYVAALHAHPTGTPHVSCGGVTPSFWMFLWRVGCPSGGCRRANLRPANSLANPLVNPLAHSPVAPLRVGHERCHRQVPECCKPRDRLS